MKYYIINAEGKEVSFDITSVNNRVNGLVDVDIQQEDKSKKKYFIKSIAGKNYISSDMKTWEKVPAISTIKGLVNINQSLNVYRGFKPSGLSQGNAGNLVTDMPGKVVKIMTTEGAVVQKGDTLLILEAMKMENEIKAGVDGVVKSVNVKVGDALESGQLMIEIEE
jgi:biotin carboxyl carrier protein